MYKDELTCKLVLEFEGEVRSRASERAEIAVKEMEFILSF